MNTVKNTKVEFCLECEVPGTPSRSPKQHILKESKTASTLEDDDQSSSSNLDQGSTDAVINSLDELNLKDSQNEKEFTTPVPNTISEDNSSYGLTEDGLPDPEAKGACHLSCFLYRRNMGEVTHINLDNISCRRLYNRIKR
jgi:hypothetical protein